MKYSYNLSGANQQLIKEYDIASDRAIKKGQPVTLEQNRIIDMSHTVFTPIGIAEEDHSGVKEELNARSNGTKIRVSMSPTAVYTAKAKTFEVTGPGFGTFQTSTEYIDEAFLNNHKLVFVEKGKDSATAHAIGSVFTVINATTTNTVLEITTSDNPCFCEGDKYMAIPYVGEKISCDVAGEYFYMIPPEDYEAFVCVAVDTENQTIDAKVFNSCLDK